MKKANSKLRCKWCGWTGDREELDMNEYDEPAYCPVCGYKQFDVKENNNKKGMNEIMMKLSSPWAIFYRKIEAMFIDDPEVKVIFDEGTPEVKIYVDNAIKADAITRLLPTEKEFGNVTLKITVIPENNEGIGNLFRIAFNGNPALRYVKHFDTQLTGPLDCVVFRNSVVQYFNDDLYDIHGVCSTLYQDIAKDVFNTEGNQVSYCTALSDEEND